MNIMRLVIALMMGMSFMLGLMLGFYLNLPGVSSPLLQDNERYRRDITGNLLVNNQPALERSHSMFNPENEIKSSLLSDTERTENTKQREIPYRISKSTSTFQDNVSSTTRNVLPAKHRMTQDEDIFDLKDASYKPKSGGRLNRNRDNKENHLRASRVDNIETIGQTNDALRQPVAYDSTVVIEVHRKTEVDELRPRVNVPTSIINLEKNVSPEQQFDGGSMENLAVKLHPSTPHHDSPKSPQFPHLKDIVQGVYWSRKIELLTPGGFTDSDIQNWRRIVDMNKVVKLSIGCGRMQNREVTFSDGSRACARYRINTDQMQGEIYSYYLAMLLEIPNVPPCTLSIADPTTSFWSNVADDIIKAQWNHQKVLSLSPYLTDLTSAYIPRELRDVGSPSSPSISPTTTILLNRTDDELIELVQWSDLILLDYLTANVDRVVNNMYNQQWNSDMMTSPAHNLEKLKHSKSLVFIDNESGLFHSYRLLDKYANYHENILKKVCIFRQRTADKIEELHHNNSVGISLHELFSSKESLHSHLPRMPDSNVQTLQSRISNIYNHIQNCKRLVRSLN